MISYISYWAHNPAKALSSLMSTLINIVILILSIAFYTIVERKILGLIIIRVGPNKPSFLGILVPLRDAGKLLIKNWIDLKLRFRLYSYLGPISVFTLILLLWGIIPYYYKERSIWSLLWFLSISGLGVYGVFLRGWGSDSKFSFLGSLRSVAQTISYEITLGILLLCLIINSLRFDVSKITEYPRIMTWGVFLLIIWLIRCLIETNRAPFDLAEGESELVRGFNTEYGRLKFALLFLGEYGTIIFLSIITRILFCNSFIIVIFPFLCVFFIWARRAYPRIRYDEIIKLIWKILLPLTLGFLVLLI